MLVRICKVPLITNSYQNVFNFRNELNRDTYFKNLKGINVDINTKSGNVLTSITVKKNLAELDIYNYLFLEYLGKKYFYFILSKNMINENHTELELQKDIFTTHQFDINYHDSFVERCHVKRWEGDIPTRNTVDEGLDMGEIIQIGKSEEVFDFSTSIIMASSVPIGTLDMAEPPLPNIGGDGNPTEGLLSKKGYIYLKQEEGFAPYPFDVEGQGYDTAGYGCHSHYQPSDYRKLSPFPTTEKQASEVLATQSINNFAKPVADLIADNGISLSTIQPNQFDVWTSIAMNYGLGGLQKRSAWKHFLSNPTDINGIADRIASETANPNRRRRESVIYRSGKYPTESEKDIGKYNSSGQLVGRVDFPGHIPSIFQGVAIDQKQLKIVQSARKLIGLPYRWGGNYPPLGNSDGTDCSGLCQWAYNDNGLGNVVPGRWTTSTMPGYGKHIKQADIQIGDCIITSGHVVIYSGVRNGKHHIIEAPSSGKKIREREYTFPSNIVGIRRYV